MIEKGEPQVGEKRKLTKKFIGEIWGVQIYKLFQNERGVEGTGVTIGVCIVHSSIHRLSDHGEAWHRNMH